MEEVVRLKPYAPALVQFRRTELQHIVASAIYQWIDGQHRLTTATTMM